jgi:hypothetical protein
MGRLSLSFRVTDFTAVRPRFQPHSLNSLNGMGTRLASATKIAADLVDT